MKPMSKQQTVLTMARPCSVSKEFTPISVHSPDRQLVYGLKTQQQTRVQTYVGSPYMQSPSYEANKQVLTSPNLPVQQPVSPKKLLDSYHYKQKTLDYKPNPLENQTNKQQEYKPFETTKQLLSQVNQYDPTKYDVTKYDFAKTYQFDKENRQLDFNSEKRKQESNPFIESKENIKIGLDFLSRSPPVEMNQNPYSSNFTSQQKFNNPTTTTTNTTSNTLNQKSRLQNEINKISSSLRELISWVQKQMGSQIPDSLNDKMIDVLSNFRKLEEIALTDTTNTNTTSNSNQQENEQRIQNLTEDYNKLKGILDQLQTKMASLVQENQKLNKNLIDQEQKVQDDQRKKKEDNERSIISQQEFNRVLECLQINQRENEELKQKLQSAEKAKNEMMICRQLFQQDEQVKEINKKYLNLQRDYEQLEFKYKQSVQEKSFLQSRDITKSPSILRSPSSNPKQIKQNEQLELKLFQLQIENDNLKAEMAHNQVDSKQLDQKNSVIAQLEEKVKSTIRERAEAEDHLQQICYNLETQIDQMRGTIQQKEQELNQANKQKKEVERDFQSSVQNYQILQKGLEDKLNSTKNDYDKLLTEFKQADSKKNKFQDDLKITEKQLESAKLELNNLREDYKKLQDKLQTAQKQSDQQSQQLQQFQQSTQQLLKQIDNFKNLEYQLKAELDKLDNALRQTKIDAKNQINDLNEALILQINRTKEKEKQVTDLIEEMSALKDQYEVQKKVQQENSNDMERKLKNLRIQLDETIEIKEAEINDLKMNMEQQLKILDKRNALTNYDFDQREQQWQQDLQQKQDIIEQLKTEIEKIRSTNYNVQEEMLKNNMQNTQLQAVVNSLKNELAQAKQEQQHLIDMLKKRKEEAEQLHLGLEEARKEQAQKKNAIEDSRRSMMRQQDLQGQLESVQRDNLALTQKVNQLSNEVNRKQREFQEKAEEYSILKRKYDETLQNLDRLEKRWGEKIDQHRKN